MSKGIMEKQIRELFKQGHRGKQIAMQVGCTSSYVYQVQSRIMLENNKKYQELVQENNRLKAAGFMNSMNSQPQIQFNPAPEVSLPITMEEPKSSPGFGMHLAFLVTTILVIVYIIVQKG